MAEKKTMTKAELREKAEELTLQYNNAYQNNDFNTAKKLSDEIEQAVNEHTSIARDECFKALAETDDPMLASVRQLTFKTIKIRDTKEGEAKIPVRHIDDTERAIDLLRLHKSIVGGIGKNKDWSAMIEKLNFLMTAQKAIDLGIKPDAINDSYAMSDIARKIDMGKNPTSKTNILKTIRAVVGAMIGGEYESKVTSHDVNFLMSIYSRKNRKALTVTCANHRYMRQYMMEICHRVVEGKTYEIDYKKKTR